MNVYNKIPTILLVFFYSKILVNILSSKVSSQRLTLYVNGRLLTLIKYLILAYIVNNLKPRKLYHHR